MYVHVQLCFWVSLNKTYKKEVPFMNFGVLRCKMFGWKIYNDLNIGKLFRFSYINTP